MINHTRFIWFPITVILGSLVGSLFLCLGLYFLNKAESYSSFCCTNVIGYFFVILSMNYIYFVVIYSRSL